MNDAKFNELLAGVEEMDAFKQGKMTPGRQIKFAPSEVKAILGERAHSINIRHTERTKINISY